MSVYRERKRAILKSLIKQYGKYEAYDMYSPNITKRRECEICGGKVTYYSEYHETGYAIEKCSNGCWKHETYGSTAVLETKNYEYSGELTYKILCEFNKQIENNARHLKKIYKSLWKRKKSQRKKKVVYTK